MNEREACARAADIMSQRGKTEGEYHDPYTGAVCMLGALASACGAELRGRTYWFGDGIPGQLGASRFMAAWQHLSAVLDAETHHAWDSVADYSDHNSTEDAILLLKKAGQ